MKFKEHVYRVLIVSSSDKFSNSIINILPESNFFPVITVHDTSAARRELLENPFDLVLINAPLPDDFGSQLSIDTCSESSTCVLLLVKAENFDDIYSEVSEYGVLTLQKPTTAQLIDHSLRLLCATRERLLKIEKKTETAENKLEEIHLVNRAKWLLIGQFKMTEQDAHHFIEKQAMERRCSRREVAANIIKSQLL